MHTCLSQMIALCRDPKEKDALKSGDIVVYIKPTISGSRPCHALKSDAMLPQKNSRVSTIATVDGPSKAAP